MEINIGGYKLVIDKGEVRASSEIITSTINFTNLTWRHWKRIICNNQVIWINSTKMEMIYLCLASGNAAVRRFSANIFCLSGWVIFSSINEWKAGLKPTRSMEIDTVIYCWLDYTNITLRVKFHSKNTDTWLCIFSKQLFHPDFSSKSWIRKSQTTVSATKIYKEDPESVHQ